MEKSAFKFLAIAMAFSLAGCAVFNESPEDEEQEVEERTAPATAPENPAEAAPAQEKRPAPKPSAERPALPKPTPSVPREGGAAQVVNVDAKGKFVVLDFGDSPIPEVGTELPICRGQEQVGSVRIAKPVKAPFAPADIIKGPVQVGDRTR